MTPSAQFAAPWTRSRRAVAVAVAGLLTGTAVLASCSTGGDDDEVVVFAAASLADAFGRLGTEFERTHPDVTVTFNFAASSSLREQIIEGAPADVFASANEANVAAVIAAGATSGDPVVFARNRMVLAVPAGNPAGVSGPDDLSRSELTIGICAAAVPCGDVAARILEAEGLVAAVDTTEPDARALTTKLGSGELDAAIVYVSDVTAAAGLIEIVTVFDGDAAVTEYHAVAIAEGGQGEPAEDFLRLLTSPVGATVLADHGFEAP